MTWLLAIPALALLAYVALVAAFWPRTARPERRPFDHGAWLRREAER